MMSMEHPHILRVLDFGMQENVPFLVMAYAPQGSLRDLYPKGSCLPLSQIVTYIQQAASALQYIHDRQLIHRDVKPENMLISQSGTIALSDFGIAIVAHSERSLQKEYVGGTGVYMAPEQFQGKPRTASDQYALGIVTYEWITGTPPFRGSIAELAYQHVSLPPRPPHELVSISPQVETVILTALAKNPQERFPSVQDFASALEQATHTNSELYLPNMLSGMSGPMLSLAPAHLSVLQEEQHQLPQDYFNAPTQASSPSPISFHPQFQEPPPALRTPSFVSPLPAPKKKGWWSVLPFLLILGAFLVVSGGALSMTLALTRGFTQSNGTSGGGEMTTAAFLQDLKQQNYNQAYSYLDTSLTLVMTVMDFTRQAQADDRCYGSIVNYAEVVHSETIHNGKLSVVYNLTRSKFAHPYALSLALQQDPGSGVWLISGYGKNGDLGPAPPVC
jgi:serine/threonine protein kinase